MSADPADGAPPVPPRRRVLVLRAAGRGEALRRRLADELALEVDLRPAFALVAPADPDPARVAVRRLGRYDWVVFTSAAGVDAFGRFADDAGQPARPLPVKLAAIGEATAGAIRRRGWPVELTAADARSEGLAAALGGRIGPGSRLLLVRPERSRGVLEATLASGGARVDAVTFYRNAPAPGGAELARDVAAGRYDIVVFASPSGLERLREAAGPLRPRVDAALAHAALVAIGPVTAEAVRRAGFEVRAIAARPGLDGLVAAVAETLAG